MSQNTSRPPLKTSQGCCKRKEKHRGKKRVKKRGVLLSVLQDEDPKTSQMRHRQPVETVGGPEKKTLSEKKKDEEGNL